MFSCFKETKLEREAASSRFIVPVVVVATFIRHLGCVSLSWRKKLFLSYARTLPNKFENNSRITQA